jgi:hypothetical protein
MILFYENGKLGNQLFQYCGIKKYFPNHRIIFFGLDNLRKTFDKVDATFIQKRNLTYKIIFRLIKLTLFLLVYVEFIGQIKKGNKKNNFKPIIIKGFLLNVYFVNNDVFFQSEDCINEIATNAPVLKKKIKILAKNWLKKKKIFFNLHRLVFVHIRRGDYLIWPSKKFPAVLDLAWYRREMTNFNKWIKKPIFVLFSDDQNYLKDKFKESNSLIISNNAVEVDLAIMSFCSHGILSASTFSWWGSFFAKFRKKNKNLSRFVAPKFWFSHRSKKSDFSYMHKTDWITFVR